MASRSARSWWWSSSSRTSERKRGIDGHDAAETGETAEDPDRELRAGAAPTAACTAAAGAADGVAGNVLAALPALGLLLGVGMGAQPVAVLLGSSVGHLLLLAGTVLTCAGLLWSARIVGG